MLFSRVSILANRISGGSFWWRPLSFVLLLYHFVQFSQGGTGGQAGRNLDVGHPEGGQGHLPDFGQSKSSAAC